jgi:hypothetical protein
MSTISYDLSYNADVDLVMSPQDLRDSYLFGVNIRDDTGHVISDESYRFYIKAAQREIENFLALRLQRQVIEESQDFVAEDWKNWGYVKCSYPISCPISLEGFLSTIKQITYPPQWLSVKKIDDNGLNHRNLSVVPAGDATTHTQSIIYSGLIPQLGQMASKRIPNFWNIKYVTGFVKVPNDILNAIGQLASISLFHIAGDLIIGAGIASQSVGIDGLSQSISTTSSATNAGYGARITGYVSDLKHQLPRLKSYYRGFSWGAI